MLSSSEGTDRTINDVFWILHFVQVIETLDDKLTSLTSHAEEMSSHPNSRIIRNINLRQTKKKAGRIMEMHRAFRSSSENSRLGVRIASDRPKDTLQGARDVYIYIRNYRDLLSADVNVYLITSRYE